MAENEAPRVVWLDKFSHDLNKGFAIRFVTWGAEAKLIALEGVPRYIIIDDATRARWEGIVARQDIWAAMDELLILLEATN